MPLVQENIQIFGSLNAVRAEDKLDENEVPRAENIDFSYEDRGAVVRQGCVNITKVGTAGIDEIFRHDNATSYGAAPLYVASNGIVYKINGGFTPTSTNTLATGGETNFWSPTAFASFRNDVFIASGTNALRDQDGTSGTAGNWVIPPPATAPTLTPTFLTPLTVEDTWTVSEGAGTSAGGVGTGTTDATTNRVEFSSTSPGTGTATAIDLNTNTVEIGDSGIHHIDLSFDEPANVKRVTLEYSIADTTFSNVIFAELDVESFEDAQAPPEDLIEGAVESSDDIHATLEDIQAAKSSVKINVRPAKQKLTASASTFSTWSIPVPFLQFRGKTVGNGLEDVQALKLIVDCTNQTVAQIKNWVVTGSENFSLTDPNFGYTYWETHQVREDPNDPDSTLLEESAPSPASDTVKVVNGRITVNATSLPDVASSITHRAFYRRGGFLDDAYLVKVIAQISSVINDGENDVRVLLRNIRMKTNLRTSMPTFIRAISPPFNSRLFVGYGNNLIWSLPGRPSAFPVFSETVVSHDNDWIQKLFVWGDILTIVNRDSIYEMRGSIFEGIPQNWTLSKTGARGGSVAHRATINTPYGILLVREDGLFLYVPGQGIDVPLQWAMDKLGDLFKSSGGADPATLKGSRIGSGMNHTRIFTCCAAYHKDAIWFAWPDGSDLRPSRVAKLDMIRKSVSLFNYPFDIWSLLPTRDSDVLLAGIENGGLQRLNQGLQDEDENGAASNVTFDVASRRWTVPSDTVAENLFVEYVGGSCNALAIYDGTSTSTLETIAARTNTGWENPTMSATVENSIQFRFQGTQTPNEHAKIFNLNWDAIPEPKRVTTFRSDHFINQYEGDKIWDVLFSDIEVIGTGAVTATAFVDNTAVMTQTISGPTNGRIIAQDSYPVDTIGEVAYTLYTSSLDFKLWQTRYSARNEPPKVNSLKTEVESLEENIIDAVDIDVNPGGTLLSTVFVDNSSVGTYTSTGTSRQSYTHSLPVDTYGRTVYTIHSGTAFKHYKTWYHMRLEPDRWDDFVTDKQSGNEQWLRAVDMDINPLGNTVRGTMFVDDVAVATATMTGTQRHNFVEAYPLDTFGRAYWIKYDTVSGRFKHYKTSYDTIEEPDRIKNFQYGPIEFGEERWIRTLVSEINPLGATVNAVVYADGTAITTATLTGTNRQSYVTDLSVSGGTAIREASRIEVDYTSTGDFKHHNSEIEAEPKPFGKLGWVFAYTKIGGASRLDHAASYNLDIEVENSGTATITSIWEVDGVATHTATLTVTGREWLDNQPLPNNIKGYLFKNVMSSTVNFRVWRSGLDIYRTGRKGVTIASIPGTPQ